MFILVLDSSPERLAQMLNLVHFPGVFGARLRYRRAPIRQTQARQIRKCCFNANPIFHCPN